jgi:hypothetical protein
MKKLTLLVLFASLTSVFLNSCKGDDPAAPKPTPSINFKGGANYVSSNVTLAPDTTYTFGINANGTDGEKISRVRVTANTNGTGEAIIFDSTMKLASYNREWTRQTGTLPGSKTVITITATQTNNESSSVSFTITVGPKPKQVQVRPNITMGAQSNSTSGSFFDFSTTTVKLLPAANSNPELIDFIYYYGATNKATFSAADDAQVTQIFPSISNWSVKKASRFRKTTMSATDFDNMNQGDASTPIDDQAKLSGFATKVTDLKVGDVIVFLTEGGAKYGLIRIKTLNASTSGDITFDMKFAE